MDKKLFDEVDKNIDIVQENGKLGYDMIISNYFSEKEQNKKPSKFNLAKIMISLTSFVLIAVLTVVLILNLSAPVYLVENYIYATTNKIDFEDYTKSATINFNNLSMNVDKYTIKCCKDSKSGDILKYFIEYGKPKEIMWGTIDVSTNKHFQLLTEDKQTQYSKRNMEGTDTLIYYNYNPDFTDSLAKGTAYFEMDGQKILFDYSYKFGTSRAPTESEFLEFFESIIDF